MDDNKGSMFPAYNSDGSLWIDAVTLYAGNMTKIRLCPACTKPGPTTELPGACDQPWLWTGGPGGSNSGSYCINGWLYSGDAAQIAQYRTDMSADQASLCMFSKESEIVHTGKTPFLQDAVWVDFWPAQTDKPNPNLYLAGGTGDPQISVASRPGTVQGMASAAPQAFNISQTLPGSINIGMSDGHVEGPPLELLWNYYWNKQWVPPSPGRDGDSAGSFRFFRKRGHQRGSSVRDD